MLVWAQADMEGKLNWGGLNGKPVSASGLLPGARISLQPKAAKASLQMHLPKWQRDRLPKLKWLTVGAFFQRFPKDARVWFKGLKERLQSHQAFWEKHTYPSTPASVNPHMQRAMEL